MTSRRNFLASILAVGVAPAIVRADSLMRIVARDTAILAPQWAYDITTDSIITFFSERGMTAEEAALGGYDPRMVRTIENQLKQGQFWMREGIERPPIGYGLA
jgi:hypothetical protein